MEGREGEGREGGQEGGKEKKKIRPLNHGPVLKLSLSAAHVKILAWPDPVYTEAVSHCSWDHKEFSHGIFLYLVTPVGTHGVTILNGTFHWRIKP